MQNVFGKSKKLHTAVPLSQSALRWVKSYNSELVFRYIHSWWDVAPWNILFDDDNFNKRFEIDRVEVSCLQMVCGLSVYECSLFRHLIFDKFYKNRYLD